MFDQLDGFNPAGTYSRTLDFIVFSATPNVRSSDAMVSNTMNHESSKCPLDASTMLNIALKLKAFFTESLGTTFPLSSNCFLGICNEK